MRKGLLPAVLLLSLAAPALAQDTQIVCDFESTAAVKAWDYVAGKPRLVSEGVTQGKHALEVRFDPKGNYHPAYIYWRRPRRDWSAYDALVLDVTNPSTEPIPGYLLVADRAWTQKGRTYWNRHNGSTTFAPGHTEWVIPVRGLYRGEAGSRNNDIKRNIDPNQIVRVDFGFGRKGTTGRVIIDNLRLVKTGRPPGVWAFDFGPPAQSVMLGWTPVAHNTRYTPQRGHGWGPRGGTPWNGAARDTTFGTHLLQDFCEAGGYNFRIDVPPGRYRVLVIYENSGYWGGEQAKHSWRTIAVNGKELWSEDRPDGPAHALYRFEDVEPVGKDLWDTYMAPELAKPLVVEAEAKADGLTFRCNADVPWGSKLAALACHKVGDAKAAGWLKGQLDALAAGFRSKAVCLDRPAPAFEVAPAWRKLGFVAWPVRIEDDVTPNSLPPRDIERPGKLTFTRLAARGETETFCIALRASSDLTCKLDAGFKQSESILRPELTVVHYNTSRGFSQIAYRIKPHTLRRLTLSQARLTLAKGITRQLIFKVLVPKQTPPGEWRGSITIKPDGTQKGLTVPIRLTVTPVSLDRETDYLMGFFGLMPPGLIPQEKRWEVLDQTLKMLREYGMNAVSGGPSWTLKGWKNGQPVIDFGDCDRFFALLRKHGFDKAINAYGGPRFRGLHDRYQKGRTGAKVEQQSGLSYQEAMMRAWRAVDARARKANWPTVFYAMCDETRVRDVAERELAFMKTMAKASAAFPKTVRTSGSYSVRFNKRPTDLNDLLTWHQRFFEALDISSLNLHDPSVMAEARKLGKDIHIYNQGRTRYSFGLYQWSEYRKGVKARWQWHLNILHGYQFFDLDGREPDTAMICYGRKGIYPTIHFERCREGAEDFYLYNTLWKLIQRKRKAGDRSKPLTAAAALLEGAAAKVGLNQRRKPDWFDPDAFKLEVIEAIENLTKQ